MFTLGDICPNLAFIGISVFDNSNVLADRPYGGCAIIWHSTLLLSVCPLVVDSRSAADCVLLEFLLIVLNCSLLMFINVYLC